MSEADWVDDHNSEDWVDDPPPEQESLGKRIVRGATSTLPALGMIGGAALATPETLGLGTVAGGGLGYAGGKELQDFLNNRLLGDQAASVKPMDQVNRVGGNVLHGASDTMMGPIAGKVISSVPSMASGAKDMASQFGARALGAEAPATEEAMSAGRQALDNDVISNFNSPKDMMARNAALRTEPGNTAMVNNVDATQSMLQNKIANQSGPGMMDAGAALMTGGKSIPISLAKEGLKKYGSQNAALGLDKVSQWLTQSAPMAKLASENPQAFSMLASSISSKSTPNKNGNSQNFDQNALIQKVQGSKYSQVLQNAAQRGGHSLGAANFVLMSQDPSYRALILGDENQK